MDKCALIVGIGEYQHPGFPALAGPQEDVRILDHVLSSHSDGSVNYDCKVYTPSLEKGRMKTLLRHFFATAEGNRALFYFAGHGAPSDIGGYICTTDASPQDPGISMSELVTLANQSKAQEVVLILDCCYAGAAGDSPYGNPMTELRKGVTILAAARPTELAKEELGRGVFSKLVVEALQGGAADIRGFVDAASVYSHAAQTLGPWDQKPLFKCYTDGPQILRRCQPRVPDELLRRLPKLFPTADSTHRMAPSYEVTDPSAIPEHVAIFDDFKVLRDGGLLVTCSGRDLYWAAVDSEEVRLTPPGQRYYRMVRAKRI
jgi:hypothetical protein